MKRLQNNILTGQDTNKVINRVLDPISDLLSNTLGPNGRSVLIEGAMLDHFTTKDGHTVLSKLAFEGQLERAILNFLQKISSRINRKVGDGTTTSILVAGNLYSDTLEAKEYDNLTDFQIALKKVAKELEQSIKQFTYKSKDKKEFLDLVQNVAMVSSNYDEEIVDLIVDTYDQVGRDAAITTKVSSNSNSSVVVTSGFEHLRGMVIPTFANTNEGQDYFAAGKVKIILSETPLNASHLQRMSELIQGVCVVGKGSLILMAPSFDEAFLEFLYTNKQQMKEALNLCAVDISIRSSNAQDVYKDLKAFMRQEEGPSIFDGFHVGVIDEALITRNKSIFKCEMVDRDDPGDGVAPNNTTILANQKNRFERLGIITEKIIELQSISQEAINKDEDIARLKKRKANLSEVGLATIMVGGETDVERKAREYLIEDSVYAVKSAIEHGSVPGSNIAVFLALEGLYKKYDHDLKSIEYKVLDSLKIAYQQTFEELLVNQNLRPENAGKIIHGIIDYIINNQSDYYKEGQSSIASFDVRKLVKFSAFKNAGDIDQEYVNEKVQECMDNDCPIRNSVDTDIQILRSVVSIIGLLLDTKGFVSVSGFISEQYHELRC